MSTIFVTVVRVISQNLITCRWCIVRTTIVVIIVTTTNPASVIVNIVATITQDVVQVTIAIAVST